MEDKFKKLLDYGLKNLENFEKNKLKENPTGIESQMQKILKELKSIHSYMYTIYSTNETDEGRDAQESVCGYIRLTDALKLVEILKMIDNYHFNYFIRKFNGDDDIIKIDNIKFYKQHFDSLENVSYSFRQNLLKEDKGYGYFLYITKNLISEEYIRTMHKHPSEIFRVDKYKEFIEPAIFQGENPVVEMTIEDTLGFDKTLDEEGRMRLWKILSDFKGSSFGKKRNTKKRDKRNTKIDRTGWVKIGTLITKTNSRKNIYERPDGVFVHYDGKRYGKYK